jgi:hypothetical protein
VMAQDRTCRHSCSIYRSAKQPAATMYRKHQPTCGANTTVTRQQEYKAGDRRVACSCIWPVACKMQSGSNSTWQYKADGLESSYLTRRFSAAECLLWQQGAVH